MREIKFRGKRKDNGQWITGYFLKDEITGQCFIFALGNSVNESEKVGEDGCLRFFAFEVEENTICQYTGLKDKNGKEIYESDIVKGESQCGVGNSYGVGEVHWSYDYCGWLLTITNDGSAMYEVSMDEIGSLEVIGNIYENPDLLEVTHED